MKKVSLLVVTLLLLVIAGVAYADSLLPDDTQEFYNDCGYVCYVWPDGSGDCYPCLVCEVCDECETPVPVPTEKPTEQPTEQPKCNRGLGNGSENCDPGNSGGKPGSAGEDNE